MYIKFHCMTFFNHCDTSNLSDEYFSPVSVYNYTNVF